MNETIPVPREMVEEILGYGTEDEPRVLGDVTYESAGEGGETVALTLAQVGDLFRWAWSDADEWFDPSGLVEGADPVQYALDCRIEGADRLRNLLLWATDHVDPIFTAKPPRLLHATPVGRDCVRVVRTQGGDASFATLERVAGSVVQGTRAYWVVSLFDGLGCTEAHIRELSDILSRLNGEIRRGRDA